MSIAKHHRLRMSMNITWRSDYVLGVLSEEGEVKMSYLRHIGIEYDIRSIVKGLMDKGLISMRCPDERVKLVKLTDNGWDYIKQVKEIYK